MYVTPMIHLATGLPGVLHEAMTIAEAEVVNEAYADRLRLGAALLLTARIDAPDHTAHCCEAVFGRTELRNAAYTLHEAWAEQGAPSREASFPLLKERLSRIEPAFSAMSEIPGASRRAFSRTITALGAFGVDSTMPTAGDPEALEVDRARHARRTARPMGAESLLEILRVSEVLSNVLTERGQRPPEASSARVILSLAVLLHTRAPTRLAAIAEAFYPSHVERSDVLESFVALAAQYHEHQSPDVKADVALLFHSLLLIRDPRFERVSVEEVHAALAACPVHHRGGHAKAGPATVLAELICLAPVGILGFEKLEPKTIAKSLTRAGSQERRARKSA